MSFQSGYDPTPLAAIVIIKDLKGIEQFRYEMQQVVNGTPVQDFDLVGGILKGGLNTDFGSFIFFIRDDNQLLIEKSIPVFPSKIGQGWEIELYFGKNPTNVNLWYRGIINLIQTITQTKTTNITVTSFGYASLTAFRYSSMNRTQKKLADGITPDPADTSTKNTELFKDVFADTDHLAVPGLGLLDIIPSQVEDLPPQLGDYRKNFVTLGSEANELTQMIGSYWGVNPDKTAYLRERGSQSSGYLITNDVNPPSLATQNWNQEKIAFIKSGALVRRDSTQDTGVTIVHGIGSQRLSKDYDNQVVADNALDLSLTHYAMPFDPQHDNVQQVSIFLARTGPITEPLVVRIVGSDDQGDPDSNDIRETKILPAALLEKELASGNRFIDIRFNKINVTKNETLFFAIAPAANGPGILQLDYDDGGPDKYFTSPDLVNWAQNNGDVKMITYSSKTVRIVGQNTTTAKFLRPKEIVATLPDHPDEETILAIFESILETQSKVVLNYEPILITPPTLPLELGKTIKIQDVNNGFDREMDLMGYELEFNAFDKNNLGASELKIIIQEIYI